MRSFVSFKAMSISTGLGRSMLTVFLLLSQTQTYASILRCTQNILLEGTSLLLHCWYSKTKLSHKLFIIHMFVALVKVKKGCAFHIKCLFCCCCRMLKSYNLAAQCTAPPPSSIWIPCWRDFATISSTTFWVPCSSVPSCSGVRIREVLTWGWTKNSTIFQLSCEWTTSIRERKLVSFSFYYRVRLVRFENAFPRLLFLCATGYKLYPLRIFGYYCWIVHPWAKILFFMFLLIFLILLVLSALWSGNAV